MLHFNSTIVRLKASVANRKSPEWFNFNSTIVRLKVEARPACFIAASAFQFYNSSIKSASPITASVGDVKFQFYNSSIKSRKTKFTRKLHFYFNSTIVRLKAEPHICLSLSFHLFQFYNSSIKSIEFIK